MDLAAATIVLASGYSMFLFCRLLFGTAGGWLGAASYLYCPYFHVNLYVRRALAEFAAFPFYPAAFYGFARHARDGDRRFLVLGSVAYAAIFLSHNPSALLFTPVLLAFVAFQAWQRRSWTLLLGQLAGIALGLAVSSFSWIPSLIEMKNVHVDRLVTGYFDYANHFVQPYQLLSMMWGYGGSVPGAGDEMSFSLGWSHVVAAAMAVAVVFVMGTATSRRIQAFFGGMAIALCLLMTSMSSFIWRIAPMLHYVQFPWRSLGVASFCLATVVSAAGSVLTTNEFRNVAFVFVLLLLLIVPNWRHPRPGYYFNLNLSEWTPDQIARRGVETTAGGEYEPKWVQMTPPFSESRLSVISGAGTISTVRAEPTQWSADLSIERPSVVEARLFYFPGWEVEVDGGRVEMSIAPVSGRILFPVPAGRHALTLSFRRTLPSLFAGVVSIGALLFALIAYRRRTLP
jgi:hypothetical protein